MDEVETDIFAMLKINRDRTPSFAGLLILLLGGTVLAGWLFNPDAMTHATWSPMVPVTALCFVFCGLALLPGNAQPGQRMQGILIWLVLLLGLAKAIELAIGRDFGIEFLLPVLGRQFDNAGHMSPQTMIGFLLFGFAMLAWRRGEGDKLHAWVHPSGGVLVLLGLAVIIGFALKLEFLFESVYLATGLIWMSLPTAFGMLVLGMSLLSLPVTKPLTPTERTMAMTTRIHRATLVVVAATAITTALVGLKFLNDTVLNNTSTDMLALLNARTAYLVNNLDNRIQNALVAGMQSDLHTAAAALLKDETDPVARKQAANLARLLLRHGFTGIGLDSSGHRTTFAGRLLPDKVLGARFANDPNTSLVWQNGFVLRVRVPLSAGAHTAPRAGFLILEQSLPHMNRTFDAANHWGETGAMPLCARRDSQTLLCFPQREQQNMYVVQDTYNGQKLPMSLALAGDTNVAPLIDYRGHRVLSAFGPVGDTGLGVVLRKDLSEIYAPVRREFLLSIPLVILLIIGGLGLIRSRVMPLTQELENAHASEAVARTRLDMSMQGSPDGFMICENITDAQGEIVDFRLVYVNQKIRELSRRMAGDAALPDNLVDSTFRRVYPGFSDTFEKFKSVARSGQLNAEEMSLPGNTHQAEQWFLRQVVAIPNGIAATWRDITREKLLVGQLELANQFRSAIVESAAYAIISSDVDGTILSFNKAAERMLGYRADELIGQATPGVFHDHEEIRERAVTLSLELGHTIPPGFEVFVAKARRNIPEEREWTYVRKDGSRFPVLLAVSTLRDEAGNIRGFLGIAHDITERKRIHEQISYLALHDALTGLPNRTLFEDRIKSAIELHRRNHTPFSVAMIDIDRFKTINDSMGHQLGDALLKGFVARVNSCLRPTDTFARVGGDEFSMLLSESDEIVTRIVMERVLKALNQPIDLGGRNILVTSSIGISAVPRDGLNIQELLRRADLALYWVKEHGRNGYQFYSPDLSGNAATQTIQDIPHGP